MKVVVTGATGSIGTSLLNRAKGYAITGLARHLPDVAISRRSSVEWTPIQLGAPGVEDVLTKVFAGADAVVHLAWAINPSPKDPPMRQTNHDGSTQVLAAVERSGVPHLICASSVAAYSPAIEGGAVDEHHARGGIAGSAYSRGKVELESQLDAFAERNPGITVSRIRPCGVVQRSSASQIASWVLSPIFPLRWVGSRLLPIPLWTGLRAQVVHADDVADAIVAILRERASGAFNLAADPVLTADELAGELGGFRVPVARSVLAPVAWTSWRLGVQPLHPGWLALADQVPMVDTKRANEELDWRPRYDSFGALRELTIGLRDSHSRGTRFADLTWGRPLRQSQVQHRKDSS